MVHGQPLGIDSCGIFCIGGWVQVSTPWSLNEIDILTAVAGDIEALCSERGCPALDWHSGANTPGQHWSAYRSRALTESQAETKLEDRLVDLLTPSTSQAQLQSVPKRQGSWYCPYLRFKQKKMNVSEWLVNGKMHNGAQFPLCVFTNNSSARSEQKAKERGQEKKRRAQGKRQGKGELKGRVPAVAADHAWRSDSSNRWSERTWQATPWNAWSAGSWSSDLWS